MATKVCSKCREEKDANTTVFYRKKNGKLTSWCKMCCSKISAEYYKNPETKKKKKKYAGLESTKKLIEASQRKPSNILKNLTASARKRGADCFLTEDDIAYFLKETCCYYCGLHKDELWSLKTFILKYTGTNRDMVKVHLNCRGYAHRSKFLSFDRKNSLDDYTFENCVMACSFCNDFKGWAISADQYKLIAPAVIANIVRICKEAGLEI